MPVNHSGISSISSRYRRWLPAAVVAVALALVLSSGVIGTSSQARTEGVWISSAEIRTLPAKGTAWNHVKSTANGALEPPNISNNDSDHDIQTLAVALVYGRTGQANYRRKAIDAIMSAIGTEEGANSLAIARNLVAYVIAADIAKLPPVENDRFRAWLRGLPDRRNAEGSTLSETHEWRATNWGTHAGASLAAVAVYVNNKDLLSRTARVFKGWLGDTSSYSGFNPEKDQSWQCDESRPVGVNRAGCLKHGHSLDGVLPYDQRRSGPYAWPPPKEPYVYGGLQGALVQAEILSRAGYPAWEWENRALLRAFRWLHEQANYPAPGPSEWTPWLVNRRYGTRFPTTTPANTGKNMAWTDWTHS